MTALLSLLAAKAAPYIIGGGAVLAIFLTALGKAFKAGKTAQKAKEAGARDIADQVDNDIGALPSDAARKELGKWSKG